MTQPMSSVHSGSLVIIDIKDYLIIIDKNCIKVTI